MKRETLNKIMNSLLGLSATAILIGAFFKLQHYPYGDSLVIFGLLAQFLFSSIEISRLKKTIKKLEEKLPNA
jgi:hypothetical protein